MEGSIDHGRILRSGAAKHLMIFSESATTCSEAVAHYLLKQRWLPGTCS
jgi:hypothetical protein